MVPASIFVGYEIGDWLDGRFSTHYLKIVFVILGTVSGFMPMIRDINRNDG